MDLLQRVAAEKPSFADEILEPMPVDFEMFAVSHYWCDSGSINVQDVAGTAHPDYRNSSWLNLLTYGKRMERNLRLLQENPGYYASTFKKDPSMYFIKVNDKTFIGSDGNHRTCIARFLFYYHDLTTLHGVTVNEYTTDDAFAKAYSYIEGFFEREQLPVTLKLERETIKRNDTGGWMREFYDLKAIVKNHSNGYEAKMTAEDMMTFIGESEKPFRSFTSKYKELFRR